MILRRSLRSFALLLALVFASGVLAADEGTIAAAATWISVMPWWIRLLIGPGLLYLVFYLKGESADDGLSTSANSTPVSR